jgi:hypothetical protein
MKKKFYYYTPEGKLTLLGQYKTEEQANSGFKRFSADYRRICVGPFDYLNSEERKKTSIN